MILEKFPPKFARIVCHHVTICFNLTVDKYRDLTKKMCMNPVVKVHGYGCSDKIEAIMVSVNGEKDRDDGSFYHVTLSLEPPAKPVDSNKLSKSVEVNNLILEGQLTLVRK